MEHSYYYDDLPVSTQTFIVRSNISSVNLAECFANLTVKSCITAIKYKHETKDAKVTASSDSSDSPKTMTQKKKKKKTPKKIKKVSLKNFLNCVTLTVQIDKRINVKIFNNGTFQMTGCKKRDHVGICMNAILEEFDKSENKYYTLDPLENGIVYYVISVMRNVDFDIGFKIDRSALGTYVDGNSIYSVPPMTTGYMGVKIKIPVDNVRDIRIPKIAWPSNDATSVSYEEFFGTIYPAPKKLTKKYFVSLSVFQNGKVLISGVDEAVIKPCYYWFKDLIAKGKNEVKVTPIPKKTFIRALQIASMNKNN